MKLEAEFLVKEINIADDEADTIAAVPVAATSISVEA